MQIFFLGMDSGICYFSDQWKLFSDVSHISLLAEICDGCFLFPSEVVHLWKMQRDWETVRFLNICARHFTCWSVSKLDHCYQLCCTSEPAISLITGRLFWLNKTQSTPTSVTVHLRLFPGIFIPYKQVHKNLCFAFPHPHQSY